MRVPVCTCVWLQLHAEYSERLKHLKQFELKLHEQFRSKEEVGPGGAPCGEGCTFVVCSCRSWKLRCSSSARPS